MGKRWVHTWVQKTPEGWSVGYNGDGAAEEGLSKTARDFVRGKLEEEERRRLALVAGGDKSAELNSDDEG